MPSPTKQELKSLLLEALVQPLGLLLETDDVTRALQVLQAAREGDPAFAPLAVRPVALVEGNLAITRVRAESGTARGEPKRLAPRQTPKELLTP